MPCISWSSPGTEAAGEGEDLFSFLCPVPRAVTALGCRACSSGLSFLNRRNEEYLSPTTQGGRSWRSWALIPKPVCAHWGTSVPRGSPGPPNPAPHPHACPTSSGTGTPDRRVSARTPQGLLLPDF